MCDGRKADKAEGCQVWLLFSVKHSGLGQEEGEEGMTDCTGLWQYDGKQPAPIPLVKGNKV